eukprot:Nitzschia sp. Nitz4//scaffold370_size15137//3867//7399//NITZ4_008894-RA/size15137-snap-gene-0.25-mRNA-1//1//CDS//3329549571//3252//frame0
MANNASPFDFDVDFDKVQRRRDQYLAKKAAERGETLMQGMDADDNDKGHHPTASGATGAPGFRGWNQWLRGPAGDGHDPNDPNSPAIVLYGGKQVTQWPYDNYHSVQQKFYVKLEELEQAEAKESDAAENAVSASAAAASTLSSQYQRPRDPPDIPTAVRNLPLHDFESKAEERAIALVGTWLFDCGLMDELLVHGGMGEMANTSASDQHSTANDSASLPSQQGVEIGPASGFPIEGPSKMDKEMAKLKATSQRTLALINARLNDGVAASGAEVQELVNAVNSTKDDLGRLRELSTYISSSAGSNTLSVDGSAPTATTHERSQTFMLTRYPKLKKAINARRNLARCFRELDFYSQIPVTCDRLREELHANEWSEDEWGSLRQVGREHVELEIFLVEAEAGMKKRIDEEAAESRRPNEPRARSDVSGTPQRSSYLPASGGLPHNYEEVDHFLHEHVKNVWELGDEIRLRIMSGIGSAFELAMNNPAGMVALVEAVEVYETANEEYKTVHGEEAGRSTSLRFTDMRASALRQIYQDFELRSLEVFREVNEAVDDEEDEEDAANALFSAVLRACNHLTSEIVFVKNQMSPCFPSYWALEMLWSTCVAHISSKQILDQIGGTEGHNLPDLTVTQLLDLVAWVENFRETIEETFPNIGQHSSKKTYFDEKPDLLQEDNKQVDMDVAKDSLAWANNMLWEVHDLAKDEFLYRTKEQTNEWLDNVYIAEHTKSQSSEGRLITSLCEDVYSLAGVQLKTIRERLTRRSEALVQAVAVIFKNLYEKQINTRNNFLQDFETCCAATNDFVRMSEKCEEILSDLKAECNLSPEASEALDEQSAILLGLYFGDAVFASQKIHIYIFEPIEEAIAEGLFGESWLDELTNNELALTLVRTLEDFMGDLEIFMDDLMVGKTLDALVTASVNFYIKTLLSKSHAYNNNKKSYWSNNARALDRMRGDINTMKEYFESLAPSYPSLARGLEGEFEVLDTVHELLSIAAGISKSTDRDFVIFLQKRIKNFPITKLVVGDLWHLVKPEGEKAIYEMVETMEEEMAAVAPNDETAVDIALARQTVPGLRLDQELAMLCAQSKRSRPGMKRSAMDQADAVLGRWRQTFDHLVEEVRGDS